MPKPSLALASTITQKPKAELAPKLVLSTKLNALCEELAEVSAKRSQINAKYEQLKSEMAKAYAKHGAKFETAEYLSTNVPGHNTHIDATLLAQLGVRAKIIAKATVRTEYTYPRVTKKKEQPKAL